MGDSFGSQIPNIGGMRKHWNQVTVDGLNGNELSGTNRMNSSINLDAIAEVKVLLNTYKAEFGHSGGANIEIVSKSGSSNYHGLGLLVRQARHVERDAVGEQPRRACPSRSCTSTRRASTLADRCGFPGSTTRRTTKKLFFFYSFEGAAGAAARPDPPLPHADRARAAGRLLADVRRQRPADLHQGSEFDGRLQRDDRRRRAASRTTSFRRTGSIRTRWRC